MGGHLQGGGIWRGETPEAAARRELREEIGLSVTALTSAGSAGGIWDGRRDLMHFFELRLDDLPRLRLDNREIIAARLTPADEVRAMALTKATVAYLSLRN